MRRLLGRVDPRMMFSSAIPRWEATEKVVARVAVAVKPSRHFTPSLSLRTWRGNGVRSQTAGDVEYISSEPTLQTVENTTFVIVNEL